MLLTQNAEAGFPASQANLGNAYFYGNGVQQALLKLETARKVLRENYRLQCEYEQFNTISHLLQDWDIEILDQQFSEKIVLRWAVNPAQVEQIQDSLTQRFAGRLVLEKEE